MIFTYSNSLHKMFDSSAFPGVESLKNSKYSDAKISITCDSSDAEIFGSDFTEGKQYIWEEGVLTEKSNLAILRDYEIENNFVKFEDIVDAPNSTEDRKPLSANQGRVLNETIGDLQNRVSTNEEHDASVDSAIKDLQDTKQDYVALSNETVLTKEIEPNKFYVWGEVSSLTITLAAPANPSMCNEYMFQFTSGSTATTLSFPDNIMWYMNNDTITTNKIYQVSIVNNLAVLGGYKL